MAPQFTLFSHLGGPNGWKVAVALEELGLTYETKFLNFQNGEHKAPEHTKHNPNGRIPTLIDHSNNDFTIWESNAIVEYLVDKYDKENKISFTDFEERAIARQWLYFQASGQGPYFGQLVFFYKFHPEKVDSAIKRYENEAERVWSVLDGVLADKKWLVGNKYSIVDFSFFFWNVTVTNMYFQDPEYLSKNHPNVGKWMKAMGERPTIKKVLEDKAKQT